MKSQQKHYLTTSALVALLATPTITQAATSVATPRPVVASESGIEEIVVTAQKRSENLQNVPISITAITASP